MPKHPKSHAGERSISRDELESVVVEAIAAAPGVSRSRFKKALPKSYQAAHAQALSLLDELSGSGRVHRFPHGRSELFFARDPLATLDEVVAERLAEGPVEHAALKAHVAAVAPGHESALDAWLKGALARGALFKHGAPPKQKRYGRSPDVRELLKRELASLRKGLARLDAQGIARSHVMDVLTAELGLAHTSKSPNGASQAPSRRHFLAALTALSMESPPGALLPVRELRTRSAMSKADFDAVALLLWKEGAISLHHHDHPDSLPERERRELVRDEHGTHYVGVALRSGS
jgi:hypothetical protein